MIALWVRVQKSADGVDEEEYQKVYRKKQKQFLDKEIERLTGYHCSDVNQFEKKLLQYATLKTETEKSEFRSKNPGFFRRTRPIQFNKKIALQKFGSELNRCMALYEEFPEEIRLEIADPRIFCLGCVTRKVREMVDLYCQQKSKELKRQAKVAVAHDKEMRKKLHSIRGVFFLDRIMVNVCRQENNVYLDFYKRREKLWNSEMSRLVITEAEILEQEEEIYSYKENRYASPRSIVRHWEVHENGEKYELHFLMSNVARDGQEKIWYLTITGKDVKEEK